MNITFKDGTSKACTSPIEQKLFRGGAPAGWICSFRLSEVVTSSEIDVILTDDNISKMTFSDDNGVELFTIDGYTKVSSTVIRYSTDNGSITEIQLSKGV